jgi:hypothetical protein
MMPALENAATSQIFIDKESWDEALKLAANEKTNQLQKYNQIYQLR